MTWRRRMACQLCRLIFWLLAGDELTSFRITEMSGDRIVHQDERADQ